MIASKSGSIPIPRNLKFQKAYPQECTAVRPQELHRVSTAGGLNAGKPAQLKKEPIANPNRPPLHAPCVMQPKLPVLPVRNGKPRPHTKKEVNDSVNGMEGRPKPTVPK